MIRVTLALVLALLAVPAHGNVRPLISDEHGCIVQVPANPGDNFYIWGCSEGAQGQARTEGEAASINPPPLAGAVVPLSWDTMDDRYKVGVGVFGFWVLFVTLMACRRRTKIHNHAAVASYVPQRATPQQTAVDAHI